MGFIATAEQAVNRALGSALRDPTEASRQLEQSIMNRPLPTAPAATVIRTAAPGGITPAAVTPDATPIRVLSNTDDSQRRAAGVLSGQSGVKLPPVGIRGAGAIARTAILGR